MVFLRKNGKEKYEIVAILEYERFQAKLALINELAKGQLSGDERGWLSPETVKAHFEKRRKEAQADTPPQTYATMAPSAAPAAYREEDAPR